MGQIFRATVYDTEKRTFSYEDADKFHANCYSFSYAVCMTHYLLRQSAQHVMWYGDYVIAGVDKFSSEDQLLGISIRENMEKFQKHDEDLPNKPYYDKVKFIDESHKS